MSEADQTQHIQMHTGHKQRPGHDLDSGFNVFAHQVVDVKGLDRVFLKKNNNKKTRKWAKRKKMC